MRIFYTILAVLLIGATVFTFILKEDSPKPQTAGLNPPHGQPGHKCELPVGAPLDGTPAPASTTPAPNTPAPTVGQNAPAKPVTVPVPAGSAAPKTNPAHGLPGHRCDLAVGAPL